MRIPESKIDEIRQASDIVDVISSYIALKKRGRNFIGLCPFHQEKTPSFNVSPDRQMYHCFGCGVGGNVFTFVMEHEKVSFIEAVRTLAERAGIALPEEGSRNEGESTENELLYEACRSASEYFQQNLRGTVEGKLALEYFHHRGFTDETIAIFGLGYSMNAWDGLVAFAARKGIDQVRLERAGLLVQREDGSGYYDRFRGRAMFPILSASGRTIAFGARKMREEDPLGKYINSPETPIYNKSRILYGLYQAREAIREREFAVLVEGYADLISVHQAGIRNVVASSGTALTEGQIQLLSRYAKSITLVYDADSAGSKATVRGVDLIIEQGMDVRVAGLPEGDDPDSFVRREGGEALRGHLDTAVSFLDFKATLFRTEGMFGTPEGQATAVRSIVGTIAKMKDELKRSFYIKHLAATYGLYESVLYRELETLVGKSTKRIHAEYAAQTQPRADGATPQQPPRQTELPAAERDLLRVMLEQGSAMVHYVIDNVGEDAFTDPRSTALLQHLMAAPSGTESDPGAMIDAIGDMALKRFAADLVFARDEISPAWARLGAVPPEPDPYLVADNSILVIRRQRVDRQIADMQRALREGEQKGDDLSGIREEIRRLLQERREIESARAGARLP